MVKVLWFLGVPKHLAVAEFETWYLCTHTVIAKGMEGIRRYAINRALPRQPVFIRQDTLLTYRVAEVWWDSIRAVETCFNSPGGLADLGDGLSHMGFGGNTLPVTLFVVEEEFPVSEPVGFNLTSGTYLGRDFLVKFFGFFRLSQETALGDWYTEAAKSISRLPGLRKHVYGRVSRETIRIGHTITWPSGGKPAYDRVIELYFDSVEAIDMVFLSPQGKGVLEGFTQKGWQTDWVAMRNQELFFSQEANQPLEK